MIINLLNSGLQALSEYLSAHVLTCLIPAFFIAGAIAVFISQASVLKYFGAKANKFLAYGVASVSGAILAVCSCTILPLFAGIRQRGAGLGPAVTFLYAGPAINILAIIYSARLLGVDIGIARALGAVVFSLLIGIIMSSIFKEELSNSSDIIIPEDESNAPLWKTGLFFLLLIVFLITSASIGLVITMELVAQGRGSMVLNGSLVAAILSLVTLTALIILTFRWYSADERSQWMTETWWLLKKIVPLLLAGVFIAGVVKTLLPESVVTRWVGGNSLTSNLLASVFGALMYFSTLTEVPIVKSLMQLGMGKGPALTLLLAGPSLSLPNMIVIGRIMGLSKTLVYILLVIIMSTLSGFIFGLIA